MWVEERNARAAPAPNNKNTNHQQQNKWLYRATCHSSKYYSQKKKKKRVSHGVENPASGGQLTFTSYWGTWLCSDHPIPHQHGVRSMGRKVVIWRTPFIEIPQCRISYQALKCLCRNRKPTWGSFFLSQVGRQKEGCDFNHYQGTIRAKDKAPPSYELPAWTGYLLSALTGGRLRVGVGNDAGETRLK